MYITANPLSALEAAVSKSASAVKRGIDGLRRQLAADTAHAIENVSETDTKPFEGLL